MSSNPASKLRLSLAKIINRLLGRETLIFAAFLALTVLMTWPWARNIRELVSDPGDPYLTSWILWWDYHQTFHDPLNLFHSNIFFPYKYTLAFSEHCYGISLLFFPFFALGFRPLTVQNMATLLGFAMCGYATFRLARTLTNSQVVAWIAGIVFAFVPYRFSQLPHVVYLFSWWIPLLVEALVLFQRQRTWPRSLWLGCAFLMNGLTCIHWLVLTIIPFVLTTAYLLIRYETWRDKAFWWRGLVALGLATVLLFPFLLPYQRASKLYGFVRSPDEALVYSAHWNSWLVMDGRNKLWRGFNENAAKAETTLFPGLLTYLLALAALFWSAERKRHNSTLR